LQCKFCIIFKTGSKKLKLFLTILFSLFGDLTKIRFFQSVKF